MPHSTSHSFSCPVRPTGAFERIRSVIEEHEAVRGEPIERIPASIHSIADDDERARATSDWIRSNPGSQRRAAADRKLRALELTVVDETGALVPFDWVGIVILPLGSPTQRQRASSRIPGFRARLPITCSSPPGRRRFHDRRLIRTS